MRNLQEQVKKAFCYQKSFWPFTVWINCSGDLKKYSNSRPSASNFKSFSRSLEWLFLTVGQNNFDNKIPFLFISFLENYSYSTKIKVFNFKLFLRLQILHSCARLEPSQMDPKWCRGSKKVTLNTMLLSSIFLLLPVRDDR